MYLQMPRYLLTDDIKSIQRLDPITTPVVKASSVAKRQDISS